MPALIGPIGSVVNMNQAVNGNAAGNPVYISQLNVAESAALGGISALIASYNSQLASSASAALATTVLNNMFVTTAAGVPAANVTALTTALTQAFDAYPTAKGQVISNLSTLLGNLESDANWGPAARAFNNQAAANYTYSSNSANTNSGSPSSSTVTTYTLTTNIETVNAGGGTVNGVILNGAGQTFQSGDTISNAANLNVTVTAAAAAPVAATLSSITNGNFSMLAADTINAALFSNVTNLGSAGGGNILTVTSGDLATTYRVVNETTGGGANNAIVGGVSVGLRAGQLSGTADVAKFSVNNAGVATGTTLTGLTTNFARVESSTTGVETISIATAGSNQIQVFGSTTAATDAKTLIITGNGTNNINAGSITQVSLIDASTSTGTNTIAMGTNLQSTQTIKGGTGTDTVSTSLAGTAAGLTFTGVETLSLASAAASVLSFSANPALTTVRMESGNGGSTDQLISADFANLTYRGSGTTAGSATTQTFDAITSSASFSGSSDTVAISFNNRGTALTTGTSYSAGAVNLAGVETLTIGMSDITATGNATIGGITGNRMTSLTATGAGNVVLGTITAVGALGTGALTNIDLSGVTGTNASTFDLATNTVTAATSIKASKEGTNITAIAANDTTDTIIFTGDAGADTVVGTTFTGTLIATGGAGGDTLTGGTGADVLTGGEGSDILQGNAAADSIILTETVQVVDTVRFAADTVDTTDTITGFSISGGDLLRLSVTQNTAVAAVGRIANANNGAVAAGASVVEVIAAATTLGATTNVIVLSGTFANDAAMITAIGGGTRAVTLAANPTANNDYIVIYTNGTNAFVKIVNDTDAADNEALAAAELSVVATVATLTGVTNVSTFASANFNFLA